VQENYGCGHGDLRENESDEECGVQLSVKVTSLARARVSLSGKESETEV
jgi:hypothetical protein